MYRYIEFQKDLDEWNRLGEEEEKAAQKKREELEL